MNCNVISVDFNNYSSISNAVKVFKILLKSNQLVLKNFEFRNESNEVISPTILKSTKLLKEVESFEYTYGSELIFALKLIEIGMEDEVTDIGWEIYKLAKRIGDITSLTIHKNVVFGSDILYAIGRTWSNWSYIMGKFFQKNWIYEDARISFDMFAELIKRDKWNEGYIDMYTNCLCSDARKLLARSNLKFYLSIGDKYKEFKKSLTSSMKDINDPYIIEGFFKDTGHCYYVKDIQDVINSKCDISI